MAGMKVNPAGLAATLSSPGVQAAAAAAAEVVADNLRAQGITVNDLDPGVTREIALPVDTAVSTQSGVRAHVRIDHPAGQAVQAKYGALTKAAAEAGLDVRSAGTEEQP